MNSEIITALATPTGAGAIAFIRLSGRVCLSILDSVFNGKIKTSNATANSIIYGFIKDGEETVDEVLVSIFKAPHSYTGEDVAEISCHGSVFIQQQILELLIRKGAAMAAPGEFTQRAFLNGKKDLLQAEAVADLIAAESKAMHTVALNQMRGGFSKELADLRDKLIQFASLIELELDFSGEDVEFANRKELSELTKSIIIRLDKLIASFALGNAIKNGIPVAIVGKPNAGKSTLLNALLNEERAIVSEIPGTTRDTIEERLIIEGIEFKIIDTAGLRDTDDTIEKIGVAKSYEKIYKAAVLLYLFDVSSLNNAAEFEGEMKEVIAFGIPFILVGNKKDNASQDVINELSGLSNLNLISALNEDGLSELKSSLVKLAVGENLNTQAVIVSNSRHYEALLKTRNALSDVLVALGDTTPADLMAIDLRKALFHLGEIPGSISTEELLGSIFGRFCIGK